MLFTFRCKECGCRFDLRGRIGSPPVPEDCPLCGGDVVRVFEPVPHHFNTVGGTLGSMAYKEADEIVGRAREIERAEKSGGGVSGIV